jgi:type VI secretion system secreted protein VgrG
MATDVQASHPVAVTTPLGKDDLLLIGFAGTEGISQLFRFQLDLIAKHKTAVPFDKLLGQPISVAMPLDKRRVRHFSGICSRVQQGEADDTYTHYRMDVVPQLWLLTRKAQSRIFQGVSVPDIIKKVLEEINPDCSNLKGDFHPRDYCVQYRETDFNFVSRVMEEEGIYYYFTHDARGHKMIVANTPGGPDLPLGKEILFHGDVQSGGEGQIYDWEKAQELRSGKYTLWDHCFEKPRDHLEAVKEIAPTVKVGDVTHHLKVDGNDKLELYDYPGEYAQRFDGVQPGGGDRKEDIDKIADDKERTVALRMQEEALQSILVQGASNCGQLLPGHKFTLKTLPDDKHAKLLKAEGAYVITRVMHTATDSDYRTGDGQGFSYQNSFTCIPADLQFRPRRVTKKPIIPGAQTATVVGSGQKDEEILTDKYGRVKVLFHWDRPGKHNHEKNQETQGKYKYSSCWVRVAQLWAGKRWGASFWPRIGQEVIVSFLEGDPDQPIIVGSVYNAEQMPPYLGDGLDSKHKNDNKVSGIKTNTTPSGKGYNELRFDDNKDKEQIFIHAERNMDTRVKGSQMACVGGSTHLTVGGEKDGKKTGEIRTKVFKDHHVTIGNDEVRLIENDQHETVKGNRLQEFQKDHHTDTSKGNTVLKGKSVYIDASTEIQLTVGGSFIKISPAGISIVGPLVKINCPGDMASPVPPPPPPSGPTAGTATRKPEEPVHADNSVSGLKSAPS